MSRLSRLGLVALVAMAVVASCSLWAFRDDGSAAGPATQPFVRRAPYVASDGLLGTPTPSPTPSSQLDVVVRVEMEVQELSLITGGTTPVTIKAEARTKFPGFFGPPEDTLADLFATAHPNDALLHCGWKTVYADEKIKVTISDSQGVFTRGVLVKIERSGWHFDVTCGPGHYQRVPASGEESVGGWLGLIAAGSDSGAVIDTPDYSGSLSCIKRQGSMSRTHPLWGTAKITVYAVVPGCIVPP